MAEYLVKKVKVNTKKLIRLFSDGNYSDDGVNYYCTSDQLRFFVEYWSRWQDTHDFLSEISRQEFVERMLTEQSHPDRAIEALEAIGYAVPEIEY